jgi:nickel/cobalt transporter (NicO) family protein
MRAIALTAGVLAGALVALLWATGGLDSVAAWAADGQRMFQNSMAGALRRLKAGDSGAISALMALCFGYGFLHSAGPGHGKFLIGGYGLGSGVRLGPLLGIAVASSLAQATTAIAMVYAGVLLFEWTREQMVGVTEQVMAPISYAAILSIGLWLVWRGTRTMRRRQQAVRQAVDAMSVSAPANVGHAHGHGHASSTSSDEVCDHCGHSHGPTMQEVAGVSGWRDAAVLVASIAVRPCTGALFLLILTWRMGIDGAGIAGTYVMALGTASVTAGVALVAVLARDGVLATGTRFGAARAILPSLEIAAGATIVLISIQLLRPFF